MDFLYNTDLVVAISFVLFFALLYYLGVHTFLAGKLDERAEGIKNDLAEARRLREEAQEIFATFERKQKDVASQAEDIVANAKREAEAAAEQAKAELDASIERRLKRADEQIELAESSAVKEVRDKAAQIAIAAAAEVLRSKMTSEKADGLIDSAIEEVGQRLN
ncbi:MAG: ATP F0F1 synthase subunit B [Pseudomonadota bacterium]